MATANFSFVDFELEPEEINVSAWEAGTLLDANGITPEELHCEWTEMDLYIRNECEPKMNADKIAELIAGGGWELDDLDRFISTAVRCLRLRVISEQQRTASAVRDLKFGPPLETAEAG